MTGARVTATTAAGILAGPATDNIWRLVVRNRSSTIAVHLGGPTVADTTGFQLDPGESVSLDLPRGEILYGITGSSTAVVHTLVAEA